MDDYQRAFGVFLFFGTPLILWVIGIISFLITLTIFLKRLILRQQDNDWLGKKRHISFFRVLFIGLANLVLGSQRHIGIITFLKLQ